MTLSELRKTLDTKSTLEIILPSGESIPPHFHITELGLKTKHFIDCGHTERVERKATFQIWVAGDVEHRLTSDKLAKIIDAAAPLFRETDPEIEIEYQQGTLSTYGMKRNGSALQLTTLETACLALDKCGISNEDLLKLQSTVAEPCCSPSGGCC